MPVVTGLFDTHEAAAEAVAELRALGIPSSDISLVANNAEGRPVFEPDEVAEDAGAGAGIGALLGGAGGLLAGLGAIAIPGIGPVVAGGWLLATTVGAVAGATAGGIVGGIVGALVEAGMPESEAHVYAEGVRRGGSIVSARVDESLVEAAEVALSGARVDIEARRRAYETEGWEHFDDDAPPVTPEEVRDYRASFIPPPI